LTDEELMRAYIAGDIEAFEVLYGRTVSRSRNHYFAGYSLLAYGLLVTLGPEAFIAGSLTWVVGAMLGNVLGYGAAVRLRQVLFPRG
jgi:hypothetical protein